MILLDVDRFFKNVEPITTTEIFTKSGEFNENGLFSERIFGVEGSSDRRYKFSFIELNTKIIHPAVYRVIMRLDRKFELFFSTKKKFNLDEEGKVIEDEKGYTGITDFIKLFPQIKFRGETSDRDELIKFLDIGYKKGLLFITKLSVIPPDFRPIFQDDKGNWIKDELNEVYLNILRRTNLIKSSPKTGVLFELLQYNLQKSVIMHDDFIRTKIEKKRGLIRNELMGKRVDFSGRGVIVPGPNLKGDEIGVPFRMAVKLFEPFLINVILNIKGEERIDLMNELQKYNNLSLTVDSIRLVIRSIKAGDEIPEKIFNIFYEKMEVVMEKRFVLAKRDPTLQPESYRALKPKLVKSDTIQISPLIVKGFSADFDGDQMAVLHPLSNESQEEIRNKMTNITGNKSMDSVNISISKEMCVGLYLITKDIKPTNTPISVDDKYLEEMNNPFINVRYRNRTTTSGKALFNSCFPNDFNFIDKQVNGKSINDLIPIILKRYGKSVTIDSFSKLSRIGFKFSTILAPSISLDDLNIPKEILDLKKTLEKSKTLEESFKIMEEMKKVLIEHLKDTGLYYLIESGAGRGWESPMQILVSKGIIADPSGNIVEKPISKSLSEGFNTNEYFLASVGARKGIIDRVINTASTGYLTRKLVYMLNSVEADPFLSDCKTKRTISLRLTRNIIKKIGGRYIIYGNSLSRFDENVFKEGNVVNLRSPIYCESNKICHTCYGDLLKVHKTPYVGVLAAQNIGERGTQIILKSFHTGGAVSAKRKNIMDDIKNNDPFISKDIEIRKFLVEKESSLVALSDMEITIDLSDYIIDDNIIFNDNEKFVWMKNIISICSFNEETISIILDYPVEIIIYRKFLKENNKITFYFKKGEIILNISVDVDEIKQQVVYLERLLGGKENFKNVEHLLQKIWKMYGPPVSDMDLVHLEVLISQTLRDKTNIDIPARLGRTWNPVMINIKQIVFESGFIQGLAFENIGKSIMKGLVTPGKIEESILEKVLTGTLIEKK